MKARKQTRALKRARAATRDVLGNPARKERVPAKWRKHYKHLIELRDQLLRRQAISSKDALEEQPTFSTHMADAGTDTYDRDFALSMLSSEQEALYEIEQALNRIQNGAYGVCELTGKRIEARRLDAIPWTRFCAAAEKQLEAEGQIKRAQLGPRQTVPRTDASTVTEEEE